MKPLLLLLALTLSACGADGAPEAPSTSGVTISGEASVGVVMQ